MQSPSSNSLVNQQDKIVTDDLSQAAEEATDVAKTFVGEFFSGNLQIWKMMALAIIAFSAFWSLRKILKRPRKSSEKKGFFGAAIWRLFDRVRVHFMMTGSIYLAAKIFPISDQISGVASAFFYVSAVLQFAEICQLIASTWIKRVANRQGGDRSALLSAVNILKWLANVVIWSVAILLVLDNLGLDVTALIAGLGVGGIAIGLAAQGIFKDLFSALSIIFDKPFQAGDNIKYGGSYGRIEEIGLKTTRIRSIYGEQIIISNANLLEMEIHNLERMPRRRVDLEVGVAYTVEPNVLDEIETILTGIISSQDKVSLIRCNMVRFGASSIDFEIVFFSLDPDLNQTRAISSEIMRKIYRRFSEENIEFAFPTQTIYLKSEEVVPLEFKIAS